MNPKLIAYLAEASQTGEYLGATIVDVNQRGVTGDTPLHIACAWGDENFVQLLLEAGADINAIGDLGNTPIFSAIRNGSSKLVQILTEHGANLSIKNDLGHTIMDIQRIQNTAL
jgi:uncharacterized protein